MTRARSAVIVDVDGCVSAVHPVEPAGPFGDAVVAGQLFGPVYVSPTLVTRLDDLAATRAQCWWLTDWLPDMRARMRPFPGRTWPVVGERDQQRGPERRWWKAVAVEAWLDAHPQLTAVAWCDDDLRGGRIGQLRRRFAERGVESLLVAPKPAVGLTPEQLDRVEAWLRER